MLTIIILGLILRIIALNQSFWLDEATSGYIVRDLSFAQIVNNFSPGDFHPPLYYFLLKIWSLVFGGSEVGLRSLSVISGVLGIYVLYRFAQKLALKLKIRNYLEFGFWKLGFPEITALILATSGLHIYFSQEARMYILASLFVSMSVYFFVKTLEKHGVGDWLGFSVFLALSSATHYLTLAIVPVYWLTGLIERKNSYWWKKFVASHIILAIFYFIWFPTLLKQTVWGLSVSVNSPFWWNVLGKISLKEILLIPVKFIIGRISFDDKVLYFWLILFCFAVFLYPFIKSLKMFKKIYFFYLWLLVPLIITLIFSVKISLLSYFRLLFILPAFYILVSFGLIQLKGFKFRLALFLVLFINITSSSVYLFTKKFQREDWRKAISYISLNSKDSSVILFPSNTGTEAVKYYNKNLDYSVKDIQAGYNEVWLMRYAQPIFDFNDLIRKKIENNGYTKTNEFDFNGVVVWQYQKDN